MTQATGTASAGSPGYAIAKILLTAEEAAISLSVSRSRVYELMAAGVLESVRIGASRRIPAEALHKYVKELREASRVRATGPVARAV